MTKSITRSETKTLAQPSWESLIVASVDSLPKSVYLLLHSSAKSPYTAARRKAADSGIVGNVQVVQKYPLNKTTGKTIFQDIMNSLDHFPYGDTNCLVKTTIQSISRKYSTLSSQDMNQIELQKLMLESQVEEQSALLRDIQKRQDALDNELENSQQELDELYEKKESLKTSIIEAENELIEKSAELENLDELWAEKTWLENDIEELKQQLIELGFQDGENND